MERGSMDVEAEVTGARLPVSGEEGVMGERPWLAGFWQGYRKISDDHYVASKKDEPHYDVWLRNGHTRVCPEDEHDCKAAEVVKYVSQSGVKYAWALYDNEGTPYHRGIVDDLGTAMRVADHFLLIGGCDLMNHGGITKHTEVRKQ
jgi:hypothetical protein